MAPISRIIIASALAALVAARPLNIGRSPAQVTETAWTTIEVPVTLWVDEKGVPLSTVAGDQMVSAATPTADSHAPTVTSTTTTTTAVAESPVAPVAQAETPAPSPVSTTSTTTSAWALPSTSFPQKQVATATPAPASGGDTGAVSASASNTCEGSGAACSGDITHYDGGLGACGWNVNTASDMQIALPVGFMGSQSNGNPYCGRSLTIKNPTTGQTAQATVGDKCMGCVGRSIDLTDALFAAIGGGCDGRCSGFEWWFN